MYPIRHGLGLDRWWRIAGLRWEWPLISPMSVSMMGHCPRLIRSTFPLRNRLMTQQFERSSHIITERLFKPLSPNVGAHSGRGPASFIFGKRCTRFRSAICPSNRASWPPMQACGPALNARC